MTTEEKREALDKACVRMPGCGECLLIDCSCDFDNLPDYAVNKYYDIMFPNQKNTED